MNTLPKRGINADIVVVGCGAAGTAAMLSAAEAAKSDDIPLRIIALESSGREDWGGSSRWTYARLRMPSIDALPPDFTKDFLELSGGKADKEVVEALATNAVGTVQWAVSKGVEFREHPSNILKKKEIYPLGGGLAVISALRTEAEKLGVELFYHSRATRLAVDNSGSRAITGVFVKSLEKGGKTIKVSAKAAILASGGFAGNPKLLSKYVGMWASTLSTTAPGTRMCKGDGLQMAARVGAESAGQFDFIQMQILDARSKSSSAVLLMAQYGIVVNKLGKRFIDEGSPVGELSDFYNFFGRSLARQPGQAAYLIADQKLLQRLPQLEFTMRSDIPPISAGTLEELAQIIDVPKKKLIETVSSFNSAVRPVEFNPFVKDGKSTVGIVPPKSNWAVEINTPPFFCFPLRSAVGFTFGGIRIDAQAQVLAKSGRPIPGLYAAGELTGMHYERYPPGSLFLRSLVFGKIAGSNAVRYLRNLTR